MSSNLLSNRLNNITESATLEMSRKSRQLKEQGFDVINLSIGEPDFNTPECIKQSAKVAIDQNMTRYTPVSGYPELRKAIAKKFKNDNDLDYTHEQIVVSNGANNRLQMLCFVCLTLAMK